MPAQEAARYGADSRQAVRQLGATEASWNVDLALRRDPRVGLSFGWDLPFYAVVLRYNLRLGHSPFGGRLVGMTGSVKSAVSLPVQVAERARRAVRKGHARSVSAYVASALDEKAKLDELATLLSEMLAESGALSARQSGEPRIDASAVLCVRRRGHRLVTSDPVDIRRRATPSLGPTAV